MPNPLLAGSNAAPLVGIAQNPSATQNMDATVAIVGMGRNGGLLTASYRGDYGELAHRKSTFFASVTTAAQAIPINTTTSASTFALLNPAGSGVVAEMIDFELDFLMTTGAPATANIVGFSIVANATNAYSAVTRVPGPTTVGNTGGANCYLGGPAPTCIAATAVTFASALTVAANWGYPMFSFPASWVPTVGGYVIPLRHYFYGKLIVPPGFSITLTASTAWAASTTVPSMSWAELPA